MERTEIALGRWAHDVCAWEDLIAGLSWDLVDLGDRGLLVIEPRDRGALRWLGLGVRGSLKALSFEVHRLCRRTRALPATEPIRAQVRDLDNLKQRLLSAVACAEPPIDPPALHDLGRGADLILARCRARGGGVESGRPSRVAVAFEPRARCHV